MRTRIILFFIFLNVFSVIVSAQDTITIMYYNILNYSPAKPANTKDLKGIVHFINPDVFAVNEISNEN